MRITAEVFKYAVFMFGVNVLTGTFNRRYLLFGQWKSAISVHMLVYEPCYEKNNK